MRIKIAKNCANPRCTRERAEGATRCQRCLDMNREPQVRYRQKMWAAIIGAYGAECACCGEDNEKFLSLDHVDGGGCDHRRSVGGSNTAVYRDVVRQEFPDSYQLLCFNCNCGRQRNGGVCPHEDGG